MDNSDIKEITSKKKIMDINIAQGLFINLSIEFKDIVILLFNFTTSFLQSFDSCFTVFLQSFDSCFTVSLNSIILFEAVSLIAVSAIFNQYL